MNKRSVLAFLTALTVIAIGAGLEPLPAAPADTLAFEEIMNAETSTVRAQATLLPTVVVVGEAPHDHTLAATGERSVMFDEAVDRAGRALAGGVDAGVRRMRLDVPFYTFGRATRSAE